MFLLREGIKPVILEQEAFPRFHIGESNTGESGQVLRRLGFEDEITVLADAEQAVDRGGLMGVPRVQLGAGALGGGAEFGCVVREQVESQAGFLDCRIERRSWGVDRASRPGADTTSIA